MSRRVRILRATVASPGVVEPGQVHDLSADEAATLVRLRKGEYVTESDEAVPPPPPTPVIDGTPLAPIAGDAAPSKKLKKPRGGS